MAALEIAVRIPGAGAAIAAVKDLHKAHAALHQPAGREALLAERLRHRMIEAVEPARGCALLRKLEDLRYSGLHAEGKLIRLDAGAQGGVIGIFNPSQAI